MTTVEHLPGGIMHRVTKLKSSQTSLWNITMSSPVASTVTRSLSNRALLGCDRTGDSHYRSKICRNSAVVSCQYRAKSLRNVSNTLIKVFHKEFRQFCWLNWIQPFIGTLYLMKWPLSEYVGYKSPTVLSQPLLRLKCKLKEFSPVLSGGIL